MKATTWMPMYWADFLADTLHLSARDSGAYILLIANYWQRHGPVNDNDEELRIICRCDPGNWKRQKAILKRFFMVKDGLWHHKRIDEELKKAQKIYAERVAAGKKGASKRYGERDSKSRSLAIAKTQQPGQQNDRQPQSQSESPLQSPSQERLNDANGTLRHNVQAPGRSPFTRSAEKSLMAELRSVLGDDEMARCGGHWRKDWVRPQAALVQSVLGELKAQINGGNEIENRAAWMEDLLKRWNTKPQVNA